MKKLVVYYSHDGNTKFVAETISKIIEANINLRVNCIINDRCNE